ncbi:hypothetical protein GIV39_26445, partial [Pseudomonas carnis]
GRSTGQGRQRQGGFFVFSSKRRHTKSNDGSRGLGDVYKGQSQGGPRTYVSPKTGKQYIVVTAGGARQSTDRGDYVIAYALP